MSLDVHVAGDNSCAIVIDTLLEIAFIYGPAFITLHYLPYCADLIDQAHRRLTPALESAVVAATELVQVCCNCLSDKQLMDNLQEMINDKILFPAIRLCCSTQILFSSDRIRRLFTCKTVKLIQLLGCRLGAENVQRYLPTVIIRLFCTFNLLYDLDEEREVKKAENCPKQVNQSS